MRTSIYFIAPVRHSVSWRVVRVEEHGRYSDERPTTWRGPYVSKHDALLAAWDAEHHGEER